MTAQEYLMENAPDLYQATLAVLEDSHQALKWRDEKIEEQAQTIEEQNRHYQNLENVAVSQKTSRDARIAELEGLVRGPITCSQCGKPFDYRACGPTHALIAAERCRNVPKEHGGK